MFDLVIIFLLSEWRHETTICNLKHVFNVHFIPKPMKISWIDLVFVVDVELLLHSDPIAATVWLPNLSSIFNLLLRLTHGINNPIIMIHNFAETLNLRSWSFPFGTWGSLMNSFHLAVASWSVQSNHFFPRFRNLPGLKLLRQNGITINVLLKISYNVD